jgi:hypothetical protein
MRRALGLLSAAGLALTPRPEIGYGIFLSNRKHQSPQASLVSDRPSAGCTFGCVSDWMKERALQTELARFPIQRIYTGVQVDRYRRDLGARSSLGLPADAKVVTFLAHHSGSTMDERKGGQVLARALAEVLIPRFPELIVLAVGGGMTPNLPNVRPVGFVAPDQVARYYSAADVFAAPSLADNLPYTVLEAMASEVPVVASRVGGIPEQVLDGETGRLFRPGSWQELGPRWSPSWRRPTRPPRWAGPAANGWWSSSRWSPLSRVMRTSIIPSSNPACPPRNQRGSRSAQHALRADSPRSCARRPPRLLVRSRTRAMGPTVGRLDLQLPHHR